jgi:hypothetical protein
VNVTHQLGSPLVGCLSFPQVIQYMAEDFVVNASASGGTQPTCPTAQHVLPQLVCTQPRRLPAQQTARRVAEEFGTKLGKEASGCIQLLGLQHTACEALQHVKPCSMQHVKPCIMQHVKPCIMQHVKPCCPAACEALVPKALSQASNLGVGRREWDHAP